MEEVPISLLVALMFVTLLSIGIANILASLAAVVAQRTPRIKEGLLIGWLFLILVAHFELFWNTLDILTIEEWEFAGFLYIVTGPILIFFAASVLIPDLKEITTEGITKHYDEVRQRFFVLVALLQGWTMGVDLIFGGGFEEFSVQGILMLLLAVVLAASARARVQVAGTLAAAAVTIGMVSLRSLGTVN